MPYKDSDQNVAIAKLDSTSDTPSFTNDPMASDQDVRDNSSAVYVSLVANDNQIIRLPYARDLDGAIFMNENDDDAGWGTDVLIEGGIAAVGISANVYDRGNQGLVVAYLFGTSGVQYWEHSLEIPNDLGYLYSHYRLMADQRYRR